MINFPLVSWMLSLLNNAFERYRGVTIKDVVEGLTDNEDLREVLAYRWNVLAVSPNELPFTVHGVFEQLLGRETKCFKMLDDSRKSRLGNPYFIKYFTFSARVICRIFLWNQNIASLEVFQTHCTSQPRPICTTPSTNRTGRSEGPPRFPSTWCPSSAGPAEKPSSGRQWRKYHLRTKEPQESLWNTRA